MKLDQKLINGIVLGIIILIVALSLAAALIPEAQTSGDELNDSNICGDVGGYYNASGTPSVCQVNSTNTSAQAGFHSVPLNSTFSSSGIVFIVIAASLLLLIIYAWLKKQK